jgi:hypothetical protein
MALHEGGNEIRSRGVKQTSGLVRLKVSKQKVHILFQSKGGNKAYNLHIHTGEGALNKA